MEFYFQCWSPLLFFNIFFRQASPSVYLVLFIVSLYPNLTACIDYPPSSDARCKRDQKSASTILKPDRTVPANTHPRAKEAILIGIRHRFRDVKHEWGLGVGVSNPNTCMPHRQEGFVLTVETLEEETQDYIRLGIAFGAKALHRRRWRISTIRDSNTWYRQRRGLTHWPVRLLPS